MTAAQGHSAYAIDGHGDVRLTPVQVIVRDIGGMSVPPNSCKRHLRKRAQRGREAGDR